MKRKFTFLLSIVLVAFGLNAQTLDPTIDWATVEKIQIPGGEDLVVSAGNDGRNEIQYWQRSATLVIDNSLFFKAAPPVEGVQVDADTTFALIDGSALGIKVIELPDYENYCTDNFPRPEPGHGSYLQSVAHPGGDTDSLLIRCQEVTHIEPIIEYDYVHQIWLTNGTTASTKRVPGTDNLMEPMHLIEAGGDLVFTAIDRSDDIRYIYRYDGTTTNKVSAFPNPYGLSQFGDEILFGVETGAGYATCITDVNEALGSRIISMDIGPCPNSGISATTQQWSQYAPFQVIHKRDGSGLQAVFFGQDNTKGVEICVTDGQTASVILDIADAQDLNSDDPDATISTERGDIIIAVNKYQAAFRVVTPGKWGRDDVNVTFQQNMWITDGTPSGTWLFEDQNRASQLVGGLQGTGNSFAGDPFLFKGSLYYTGNTNKDRQIIVMNNTYPNHVENGTSRDEWVLNGPDDADSYGNSRTGYFGTYGDYMAFSVRVDKFTTDPDDPKGSVLNRPLEHALIIGNTYEGLWVADDAADHSVGGNGNGAMIQHITQYKDKLYYNRFNENGERNLRVYIKADMADGWEEDASFWMGSFNSNEGTGSKGGPHNLRVMDGSLFFIFQNELYKLTDTQSSVEAPVYDYRNSEHYVAEGIRDWQSCIFDYGYGGADTMADDCPCAFVPVGIDEVFELNAVDVFPNPTSGILNVNIEGHQITQVVVYNLNGVKVLDQAFDSNVLDVSVLDKGLYVIGFTTVDNKFLYTKFSKK